MNNGYSENGFEGGGMGDGHGNGTNGSVAVDAPINGNYVLNTTTNTTLDKPDYNNMRKERQDRTRAVMQALDPTLTQAVLPSQVDNLSKEEKAAICIQCHFRGYLGRKKYLELLYEQFNQEEEMRMQRTLKQVEEGELLVENHKLEVEFDDNTSIRRNRSRYYITKVITIQRAWRAYLLNKANRENLLSCEQVEDEDDDEDESPEETDESSQSEMSDTESTAQESNTVSASNSSDMLSVKSREDDSEGMSSREEYVQALGTMHDLESSVELDDAEFARLQQAIEDKKNKNINNLSLAEEFANIDVANPEGAVGGDEEYESEGRVDSASASPDKMSGRQSRMDRYDSATESEERSEIEEDVVEKEETESLEKGDRVEDVRDHENNTLRDSDRTDNSESTEHTRTDLNQEKSTDSLNKQTEEKSPTTPPEGTFDVYNLEDTTLPVMDWASLEAHLANISKEEQSARESQRNNREEILRKLAMAGEDDDIEGDIYGKGKDKLSTRLQGGMNLQICFVNDPLSDSEANDEEGDTLRSPVTFKKKNDVASPKSPTDNKAESKEKVEEEEEDFAVKQARLQEEARLALAQARPMARMQIEVEKQQRKKSPVAELAGAAGLTEITEGLSGKRMLRKQTLVTMTVSQIKTIVNDLTSQIENLNEELMQQLIVRDELQMEQDSKLVDIEDLSRWINMNMQMTREKERHQPKQQRLENRNKRQYDTLLSLLSNTLPVSRKCMCGVSRSSSMSSRSISSPESQKSINSPQESIRSLTSPTDSSSTSHISSPEMTWVRQAIVKYWYT